MKRAFFSGIGRGLHWDTRPSSRCPPQARPRPAHDPRGAPFPRPAPPCPGPRQAAPQREPSMTVPANGGAGRGAGRAQRPGASERGDSGGAGRTDGAGAAAMAERARHCCLGWDFSTQQVRPGLRSVHRPGTRGGLGACSRARRGLARLPGGAWLGRPPAVAHDRPVPPPETVGAAPQPGHRGSWTHRCRGAGDPKVRGSRREPSTQA